MVFGDLGLCMNLGFWFWFEGLFGFGFVGRALEVDTMYSYLWLCSFGTNLLLLFGLDGTSEV